MSLSSLIAKLRKAAPAPRAAGARLRGAFPAALADDVTAALSVLRKATLEPSEGDIGPISIAGEAIHIPSRIYHPEPAVTETDPLSPTQRLVLACLLTRHHDGFVRARHVPTLLPTSAPWVAPFVLQLIGEYVAEIATLIADQTETMDHALYSRFATENEPFLRLVRRRAISYWDLNYRHPWPRFADYPGYRALRALGLWDPHAAPRLLRTR